MLGQSEYSSRMLYGDNRIILAGSVPGQKL